MRGPASHSSDSSQPTPSTNQPCQVWTLAATSGLCRLSGTRSQRMTVLQDLVYGAWVRNMRLEIRRKDHGNHPKLKRKSQLSINRTLIKMQRQPSSQRLMGHRQGSSRHSRTIAEQTEGGPRSFWTTASRGYGLPTAPILLPSRNPPTPQ